MSRAFSLRQLLLIVLACGFLFGGGQAAWAIYRLPDVERWFWLLLVVTFCYLLVGSAIGFYIKGKAGAAVGAVLTFAITTSPLVYFVWQLLSWS